MPYLAPPLCDSTWSLNQALIAPNITEIRDYLDIILKYKTLRSGLSYGIRYDHVRVRFTGYGRRSLEKLRLRGSDPATDDDSK